MKKNGQRCAPLDPPLLRYELMKGLILGSFTRETRPTIVTQTVSHVALAQK